MWRGGSVSCRAWRFSTIPPSAIRWVNAREHIREAIGILAGRHVAFEFDGEMSADVALNRARWPHTLSAGCPVRRTCWSCLRATPPRWSTQTLQELGGATIMGPLLAGFDRPVQILPISARDTDIANMAALAAFSASGVN